MNVDRLHALYQFALAIAGEAEDWRDRELGPIHLLKYAYLADLEWARRHGTTWTGVDWQFYHFGPWAVEAWQEIDPAVRAIGARERRIDHPKAEDDVVRYRIEDDELPRQLASKIPIELRLPLKRKVQEFAGDTAALLHHVYLTEPMLHAAPGETLDFRIAFREPEEAPAPAALESQRPARTAKQRKRRQQAIKEFRERMGKRLEARACMRSETHGRPPRYDAVFFEGVKWLDSLAGEPVPTGKLVGHIHDDVWHHPTRKMPDVP